MSICERSRDSGHCFLNATPSCPSGFLCPEIPFACLNGFLFPCTFRTCAIRLPFAACHPPAIEQPVNRSGHAGCPLLPFLPAAFVFRMTVSVFFTGTPAEGR